MSINLLLARTVVRRFALSSVSLAVILSCGWLLADSKAENKQAAEELVKEALHREIYGLSQDRDQLLRQALEKSPDYAPARWHLGYVRYQKRWVKADELPQLAKEDSRLVAYHNVRGEYANTVADQLALSDWCRQRKLVDRERAHLTQVLTLNPDRADARARLGFRRVDGAWVHPNDLRQQQQQQAANRQALSKWRGKLGKYRQGLHHRSLSKRDFTKEQILQINDPTAIPALEVVLSRDSQQTAQLVVTVLGNMNHRDASLSLARQAVRSPWESVRNSAAKQLRGRPEDSYIPAMLSSMFSPVVTQTQLFTGQDGRIMYRHLFAREGQQQHQQLVLDTEYRRIARDGGDGDESLDRALDDATDTARDRLRSAALQNQFTFALNQRITDTLNVSTGQNLPATPQLWWEWWNKHNGVFVAGDKQRQTRRQVEQIAIVDRVPDFGTQGSGGQGGGGAVSGSQRSMDCLAAGTAVWTATGPLAVEKVQVGDLVLSQDPESGELTFKPVLRTTIRPESTLVVINVGDETIRASAGHPFWVAGEGWVKARDLKSGMELHGLTGTVRISTAEKGSLQRTYNLIVADFNTYFVGSSKVLNHDNTLRQPTDAVVPGLLEE